MVICQFRVVVIFWIYLTIILLGPPAFPFPAPDPRLTLASPSPHPLRALHVESRRNYGGGTEEVRRENDQSMGLTTVERRASSMHFSM